MYVAGYTKEWNVGIKKMVRARKLATEMPSFLRMSSEEDPRSKKVDKRVASALPLQASSCIDPHNSAGVEGGQDGGEMAAERLGLEGEAAVGSGVVADRGALSPTSPTEKRMRRGTARGWLEERKKGRSEGGRVGRTRDQ